MSTANRATDVSSPAAPEVPQVDGRPVVVTTVHRGVFFGYATETDGERIRLKRGRLCLYWPRANRGFMGLAKDGPLDGSRVGPPADVELRNITAVLEVTPEAAQRWESAPWRA